MTATPHLLADRAEIARFVNALFRYAQDGTFTSLRTFDQFTRHQPPAVIPIRLNGAGLDPVIDAAFQQAQRSADSLQPTVFAPPIATFSSDTHARRKDLANGLTLSVEIDDSDPRAGQSQLESILGPCTVVVASGSDWTDPKTGEPIPKRHLHWRLSEATMTDEEHDKLHDARRMAMRLIGADPTGVPAVHPLRWPGSWNRKATPRMARIVAWNEAAEIHLSEAFEALQEAQEAAGVATIGLPPHSGPAQADPALLASAILSIPNLGKAVHYDDWIRLGYAAYRGTGGSAEGFDMWDAWSRKSEKYDAAQQQAAWKRIAAACAGSAPPRTAGAGTIFYLAKLAGWVRPGQQEEPPPASDTEKPISAPDLAEQAKARIAELVAEFNGRYMVINEAGRAMIYAPTNDPIRRRDYFTRMTPADLRLLYLNRQILVGADASGSPVFKPAAEIWLRHKDRRDFIHGVTFDPSGAPTEAGMLNLWRGFAVTPRPGKWEKLRQHVLEVICDNHEGRFDYLFNWLAHMVQRPAEPGGLAVVMRGGEGTGKGTLARAVRRIMGQHGLAISNGKHLTGNFNAHLRDCVFLFADEAFYAGDPSHVGVLKSLITEDSLTIEAKYQNAIESPNFLHLMMASNEEWVVPAALDARRFFVLEVTGEHANDQAWFGAIWAEMEAGGYEAMLHDLLHADLTGFNVRDFPITEGLQEQKKLSLGASPEAWWLDMLHRGYVFKSKLGLESFFGEWHDELSTEVLFASYSDFVTGRRERHPMSREAFGRFLIRMGAKPVKPRNAVIGEHFADVVTNQYGDTTRKAEVIRSARSHGYHLGELAAAREAFTAATGLSPDWPVDSPDDEPERCEF